MVYIILMAISTIMLCQAEDYASKHAIVPTRPRDRKTQVVVDPSLITSINSFLDSVPLPNMLFHIFRSCSPSTHPSITPTISVKPTPNPSPLPSWTPAPSTSPTVSKTPTGRPTAPPSVSASEFPSLVPSSKPSISDHPSNMPSVSFSQRPSSLPSQNPSALPSLLESMTPSSSNIPSNDPTKSNKPTKSAVPSMVPSHEPTLEPSILPTVSFLPTISSQPTFTVFWKKVGNVIDGLSSKENTGSAVAISYDGNRLVLGGSSIVRMYDLLNGAWSQVVDLSSFVKGDVYGIALSSDGKNCVVGDYSNSDNGALSGVAFVFHEDNDNNWGQVGSALEGEAAKEFFGRAVGINDHGDKVAIGTGNVGDYVKIFQWVSNNWSNQKIIYGTEGTLFGSSIAMSRDGNWLMVGAPFADEGGKNSGSAYFYSLSSYSLRDRMTGENEEEKAGKSVVLSGDGSFAAFGTDANYVKVFQWDSTKDEFIRIGDAIYGTDDSWLGSSISLSADGSRLAISQPRNNEGGLSTGKVLVYSVNEDDWKIIGTFFGENAGDYFGSSLSLSGDRMRIAIGAPGNDGKVDTGHLCVYQAYGYKTASPTVSHGPSLSISPSVSPSYSPSLSPSISPMPTM